MSGDNRNRTVAEVRHAFSKCGGNLGTDGSVAYLFSKKGVISFEKGDEDTIMEAALEAGAEDVVTYDDGAIDVYTAREEMGKVRDALEAASLKADSAEVSMIPSTKADMDAETAPKLLRLIDMLEDCDDVQEVYHNGGSLMRWRRPCNGAVKRRRAGGIACRLFSVLTRLAHYRLWRYPSGRQTTDLSGQRMYSHQSR